MVVAAMHRRRELTTVTLLGAVFLALAWTISSNWAPSRRVSTQMRWSDSQQPLEFSEQRLLRPLPDGAVRLQFVDAPNTYVVVDYPGLLPVLRRLNHSEVAVEFKVACTLWGARRWFTIRSVAGLDLENTASTTGWTESLGAKDLDPLGAACDWW